MKNATIDEHGRLTDEQPQDGELWVLYNTRADSNEGQSRDNTRFAVVECLGDGKIGLEGSPDRSGWNRVRFLWDCYHDNFEGDIAHSVNYERLVLRLPEDVADFDDDYREALDYISGYLTPREIIDVLAGEDYQAGREEGYESLRHWALNGAGESITEHSVGHGHGASRYATAVEKRLQDLPEHLHSDFLHCEEERWNGAMEMQDGPAAKLVELWELREEHLDEDWDAEKKELVQMHDLEYDEYREEVDR